MKRLATLLLILLFALFACSTEAPEDNGVSGEDASQEESEDTDEEVDEPVDTGPECPTSTDDEPVGLHLTWRQDPTTTMVIDWHTEPGTETPSTLCFKEEGGEYWAAKVEGHSFQKPLSERTIHRLELTDLEPATTYSFQVGEFGREYKFRTMPADLDENPVVFATGGDVQAIPQFLEEMNEVAMDYDLDFLAWGGDLAYANGFITERWEWWFEANMRSLIDDDGRVVPIVVGIGNHEVIDGYYTNHDDYEATDGWQESVAPFYYGLFAFPGHPGYGTLDFGDYMSFVLLDTNHTGPVGGAQTEWLEAELIERSERGVTHIFPIYHVAAYPSHRNFEGSIHVAVREHWVPLFEAHGVKLAFENHEHTYKRTHPILAGEVHDDGIVYMGDGAWGVPTRTGDNKDAWFIDQFASQRHGIIVTIHNDRHEAIAVNNSGEVIDEYTGQNP